jgi:hypothetical protein
LGFWEKETGSITNSVSPVEVAKAKSIKKTHMFVAAMEIYERAEYDQRGAGVVLQPWDVLLLGATRYIAHHAKIWQDNTLTDSVCLIVSMFSME